MKNRANANGEFWSDFSLNYQGSKVIKVTRHNRIPQFRAVLRIPNNCSSSPTLERTNRRPTFDPDKASFQKCTQNVRYALSTRFSISSRKENVLCSSTWSTGDYRYQEKSTETPKKQVLNHF